VHLTIGNKDYINNTGVDNVLRWFLKPTGVDTVWMYSGRLFHAVKLAMQIAECKVAESLWVEFNVLLQTQLTFDNKSFQGRVFPANHLAMDTDKPNLQHSR